MRTWMAALVVAAMVLVPLGIMGTASDGFDLTSWDHLFPVPLTQNVPMKALPLTTAWTLSGLSNETVAGVTYVNFRVSATNLTYARVANNTFVGDGMLNQVAFTFHLTVDTHDRSAKVPWYRITVDDGNRTAIRHVEFLGYHNVSGPAIAMGAKYDHLIRSEERRVGKECRSWRKR